MSKKSGQAAGGGVSFSALAGFVGAIVSFATTPAFIGGVGIGMAALVGLATFVGSAVIGIAGALVGLAACGIIGGAIGLAVGGKGMAVGAIAGAILGGVGGGIGGSCYGAYKGYQVSETALVQKTCQAPFNDSVAKACASMKTSPTQMSLFAPQAK